MRRSRRLPRRVALGALLVVCTLAASVGSARAVAFVRRAASRSAPVPAGPSAPSSAVPTAPAAGPTPSTAAPTSSTTGPYRTVGLGDSVPAGSECGCTSYVTLVGQQLARENGRSASIDNLARAALTTSDVLDQLRQPRIRAEIAEADLVIVNIGANDFDSGIVTDASCIPPALSCYRPTLTRQAVQLAEMLTQLDTLTSAHAVDVVLIGYWNVFLDGEVGRSNGTAYVRNSNALTQADNDLMAASASAHGDTYVDVYTPFKGDGSTDDTALLAADGDHPNAAGHRLIARTVAEALH